MDGIDSVRSKYGFTFHLKEEQLQAIKQVMAKRDTLALMPTGYGKTVIFTFPPLLKDEVGDSY